VKRNKNFKIGDLVQVSLSGRMSLGSRVVNKYKGLGIVLKKQDGSDRVYLVHWLGGDPHKTDFHADFIELVDKRSISDRLT
tara:strand:+ start:1251 stop:1493 length:243 start_codon:yes stop_codon:yes gene_type:complete